MLVRVDEHPQLLGAVWLASTLAAAGAPAIAMLGPTLQVPHLNVDCAMEGVQRQGSHCRNVQDLPWAMGTTT